MSICSLKINVLSRCEKDRNQACGIVLTNRTVIAGDSDPLAFPLIWVIRKKTQFDFSTNHLIYNCQVKSKGNCVLVMLIWWWKNNQESTIPFMNWKKAIRENSSEFHSKQQSPQLCVPQRKVIQVLTNTRETKWRQNVCILLILCHNNYFYLIFIKLCFESSVSNDAIPKQRLKMLFFVISFSDVHIKVMRCESFRKK